MISNPYFLYREYHSLFCGNVRMQLMQVYSQKSIITTLPRSGSNVSGGELIHVVPETLNPGTGKSGAFWLSASIRPSTVWPVSVICPLAVAQSTMPASKRIAAEKICAKRDKFTISFLDAGLRASAAPELNQIHPREKVAQFEFRCVRRIRTVRAIILNAGSENLANGSRRGFRRIRRAHRFAPARDRVFRFERHH